MQTSGGVSAAVASPARRRGGLSTETAATAISEDGRAPWPQRLWWTVVGCMLIDWSVQLLSAVTSYAWMTVPVVLAGGWGLATVIASWLPATGRPAAWRGARLLPWATAALTVLTFAAWALVQVRASPGYGTDEMAFDQYAAQLLQHGVNPYVHSLAAAFSQFRVSPDGYTYSITGMPVTQLSYPALSFLLYMPLLALGASTQAAVALNVLAWAATVLLMFALLPRSVRPAALVIGAISVYVSYAVGGVTDVLYMPLLVIAANRWDRFGHSRLSYLGPVAMGLAMAVKQTPWPLLPFILCALLIDERAQRGAAAALRRCVRYLAVAAAAFLLPNAWFIAASPGRWLSGILTPITSHLVPAGQGAVALSLFLHLGGGALAAFTVAMAVLAVVLLAVYVGTYPLLRAATFVLPAVVLFFASRSYGSYLVSLVPAALVGAVTVRTPSGGGRPVASGAAAVLRRAPSRRWVAAITAVAALFVGSLTYALSAAQPLDLRIAGIRTTGQLATIEQLEVRARNTSARTVRPKFTVDEGGAITTFWHIVQGPGALPPGHSGTYTIVAPNFPAQPSIGGGFTVLAFSRQPAAVSATGPYEPTTMHVALTPQAVDGLVPVGRPVVLRAQLLNQVDQPVSRADVPVYLGQIVYDQSGLELGEAQINSAAPGQTPVRAYTAANGAATFTVVGTQPGKDPVYFEANLVESRQFYPYGYSEILPIRFARR